MSIWADLVRGGNDRGHLRAHQHQSETERRDLTRQAERLEDEQMKLLQAHYAGAIPIPLLKKEQDRIGEHLDQINRRLNAY